MQVSVNILQKEHFKSISFLNLKCFIYVGYFAAHPLYLDYPRYAGYTPQDNRADFGLIFPLLTILGNLTIILVDLKIISSDFPVVWSVLRVTESARKKSEAPRSQM